MGIKIGSRVRSHDFGKERFGRAPCYVEGVVKDIKKVPGLGGLRYEILVDKRIWKGEDGPFDELVGAYVYPIKDSGEVELICNAEQFIENIK